MGHRSAAEIQSKECSNIDIMATETRPPSPEPVATGGTMELVMQALRTVIGSTFGSILEPTEMAASALTPGFELTTTTNNNPDQPQDDNHNQQAIVGIDSPTESSQVSHVEPTVMFTGVPPVDVTKALWKMALLTLILDIGTALYKPARGVVFGSNKNAYYITLAVIFVLGVIEAFTAFWMSRTREPHRRRFKSGSIVLCASIVPFVAIMAIGGFALIKG